MADHTQTWTTGPAPIATGTGAAGAMQFFGFSEDGFEVRETTFFEPIHDDARGPRMAADQMALGKAIAISGRVITYDFAVLNAVRNRYLVANGTPGGLVAGELGSLLETEGLTMAVMLKYPYSSKTSYNGMDQGLRIPQAFVMGDIGYKVGTRAWVLTVAFVAIVNFNTSTNTGTVWDADVSGFPTYD